MSSGLGESRSCASSNLLEQPVRDVVPALVLAEEPGCELFELGEQLQVKGAEVALEQRTGLAAIWNFGWLGRRILAAQHVAARAAHDLGHHERQRLRRLMNQDTHREREVEEPVAKWQTARRCVE